MGDNEREQIGDQQVVKGSPGGSEITIQVPSTQEAVVYASLDCHPNTIASIAMIVVCLHCILGDAKDNMERGGCPRGPVFTIRFWCCTISFVFQRELLRFAEFVSHGKNSFYKFSGPIVNPLVGFNLWAALVIIYIRSYVGNIMNGDSDTAYLKLYEEYISLRVIIDLLKVFALVNDLLGFFFFCYVIYAKTYLRSTYGGTPAGLVFMPPRFSIAYFPLVDGVKASSIEEVMALAATIIPHADANIDLVSCDNLAGLIARCCWASVRLNLLKQYGVYGLAINAFKLGHPHLLMIVAVMLRDCKLPSLDNPAARDKLKELIEIAKKASVMNVLPWYLRLTPPTTFWGFPDIGDGVGSLSLYNNVTGEVGISLKRVIGHYSLLLGFHGKMNLQKSKIKKSFLTSVVYAYPGLIKPIMLVHDLFDYIKPEAVLYAIRQNPAFMLDIIKSVEKSMGGQNKRGDDSSENCPASLKHIKQIADVITKGEYSFQIEKLITSSPKLINYLVNICVLSKKLKKPNNDVGDYIPVIKKLIKQLLRTTLDKLGEPEFLTIFCQQLIEIPDLLHFAKKLDPNLLQLLTEENVSLILNQPNCRIVGDNLKILSSRKNGSNVKRGRVGSQAGGSNSLDVKTAREELNKSVEYTWKKQQAEEAKANAALGAKKQSKQVDPALSQTMIKYAEFRTVLLTLLQFESSAGDEGKAKSKKKGKGSTHAERRRNLHAKFKEYFHYVLSNLSDVENAAERKKTECSIVGKIHKTFSEYHADADTKKLVIGILVEALVGDDVAEMRKELEGNTKTDSCSSEQPFWESRAHVKSLKKPPKQRDGVALRLKKAAEKNISQVNADDKATPDQLPGKIPGEEKDQSSDKLDGEVRGEPAAGAAVVEAESNGGAFLIFHAPKNRAEIEDSKADLELAFNSNLDFGVIYGEMEESQRQEATRCVENIKHYRDIVFEAGAAESNYFNMIIIQSFCYRYLALFKGYNPLRGCGNSFFTEKDPWLTLSNFLKHGEVNYTGFNKNDEVHRRCIAIGELFEGVLTPIEATQGAKVANPQLNEVSFYGKIDKVSEASNADRFETAEQLLSIFFLPEFKSDIDDHPWAKFFAIYCLRKLSIQPHAESKSTNHNLHLEPGQNKMRAAMSKIRRSKVIEAIANGAFAHRGAGEDYALGVVAEDGAAPALEEMQRISSAYNSAK